MSNTEELADEILKESPDPRDAEVFKFPKGKLSPIAENQPAWVCHDCGIFHGRRLCGIATFHTDKCGVCNKTTTVTEPRDYGYLKAGWDERCTKR